MEFTACTIVARNYLPFARVLAESLRSTNPGCRMVVLILDDMQDEVDPTIEPFEVVRPEDLEIDAAEPHRMAAIYDVMELATALKPWLLETLLKRGASEVLYLDPDIQVFSCLDPLSDLAAEHGIVLTPHTLVPFPRDKKKCDEDGILAAGIYNLGFIGVSLKAMPFLSFWQERLRRDCVLDPENMRFVDQRWVDFVPSMFDHFIVRDPEYNVAYWNLHGRELSWDGSSYGVNGRPLAFFHFSGYSPSAPYLLSKHQGDRPRILLSEQPALAKICNDYAALLTEEGHGTESQTPYGFAEAANGVRFDAAMRSVYRDLLEAADEDSDLEVPDVFSRLGADFFMNLLNRPSDLEGWANVTTYLATTWLMRPDLQHHYPNPRFADHGGFLAWARNEVAEERMETSLATTPQSSEGDQQSNYRPLEWAPADQLRPGVVVAGYFTAELGVGEGGRLTRRLIEAAKIPFTSVTWTATSSRQEHPFQSKGESVGDFDTNVVAVNADRFPEFARNMGRDFFSGRYTIGQWAWELEEFPRQFWTAFDFVDEVWALSEFNRAAIAEATDKPVLIAPLPILEPTVSSDVDRTVLGLPDRFTFLFCFDLFSIVERKNPLGLIRAFRSAFKPNEGPVLVLKTINGDRRAADLERIRWEARDRPDIVVIDRYLRSEDQASMMALCDCYVSLHRSEGLGLTMAEAMVLGKPVIATGYSGNLDFMNEEIAHLIPWERGSVPEGCDPYPQGARWAEPDVAEAASVMRMVAGDPKAAAALGSRARETILKERGLSRGVDFVRSRFDDIQRTRSRMIELSSRHQVVPPVPPRRDPSRGRKHIFSRVVDRVLRARDREIQALGEEQASLTDRLQSRIDDLEGASDKESARVDRLVDRLRAEDEKLVMEINRVLRQQQRLQQAMAGDGAGAPSWSVVQQSVAGLRAIPYMSNSDLTIKSDDGEDIIGFSSLNSAESGGYAAFEDLFRGTEDTVRGILQPYLSILARCSSVVDFGCGRGEMLDLLAKSGISAIGVDSSTSMIERCEAKGHKALLGDGLVYLAQLEPASVGAVFSAQVVEHLDHEEFLELLRQARRVLEPGGLFIAETVNPHAVHGFKTFWVDLTHRVPIFPEVLVAHCRDAGYANARIVFPGGTGDFDRDRWSVGQYAVVARTSDPS